MSGAWYREAPYIRLVRALAVVLAIVLVIPGASVVAAFLHSSIAKAEAPAGIDSAYILSAGDAFAVIGRLEEQVEPGEAELPGWFEAEMGLPADAHGVRVGAGGTVVGYVVGGDAQGVYELVAGGMQDGGWTAIPLSGEVGATFVKEEGRYTWILVTCTQAGDATSVVARCANA